MKNSITHNHSSTYAELQERKYENQEYWNMMDVSNGIDPVVTKLTEYLSSGSIFEFGA